MTEALVGGLLSIEAAGYVNVFDGGSCANGFNCQQTHHTGAALELVDGAVKVEVLNGCAIELIEEAQARGAVQNEALNGSAVTVKGTLELGNGSPGLVGEVDVYSELNGLACVEVVLSSLCREGVQIVNGSYGEYAVCIGSPCAAEVTNYKVGCNGFVNALGNDYGNGLALCGYNAIGNGIKLILNGVVGNYPVGKAGAGGCKVFLGTVAPSLFARSLTAADAST